MKLQADAERAVHHFVIANEGALADANGLAVRFHFGPFADLLTRAIGVSGITFGSHVLVRAAHVRRLETGLFLPGGLVVHETVHVHQYEALGFVPFLVAYVREYGRGLRRQRAVHAAARDRAYRRIPFEKEAYRIEREWNRDPDAWRWLPLDPRR